KKNIMSSVSDYLMNLTLRGKVSRARVKLIKGIDEALLEMGEDIEQIKSETEEKSKDREKQLDDLLHEVAIIDMTKHERLIKDFYECLLDYDEDLNGREGLLHDEVLQMIEDASDFGEEEAQDNSVEDAQFQEVE